MTLQYLSGQLSVRLAELQTAAGHDHEYDLACLRHAAETAPVTDLPAIAASALHLSDDVCWSSLHEGEAAVFTNVAAAAADLLEFSVCAGWIPDGDDDEQDGHIEGC